MRMGSEEWGWGVAMSTDVEPPEEGFKEDKENQGGQRVTLYGSSSNGDRISCEVGGALEDNTRVGVRVYTSDDVDGIGGEAQVMHNAEEFRVGDGVKGAGEINVEGIEVSTRGPGILKNVG